MTGDRTKKGPRGSSYIAIGDDYDVVYWSRKFSATPAQLAEAVKVVGNFAKAVEEYLRER